MSTITNQRTYAGRLTEEGAAMMRYRAIQIATYAMLDKQDGKPGILPETWTRYMQAIAEGDEWAAYEVIRRVRNNAHWRATD